MEESRPLYSCEHLNGRAQEASAAHFYKKKQHKTQKKSSTCGPRAKIEAVRRLKVADKLSKSSTAAVRELVHPRLHPSVFHSWSRPRLQIHGEELKWRSESETNFKKKKKHLWASARPSGRAEALCTFLSMLTPSLPVRGAGAGVKTFVDVFFKNGGWDMRCNVRVLFVSSLFLLFLSFCTIIPFFISCFIFCLYDVLLFTVKTMTMMMMMCPSTCLPSQLGSGSKDCA